MFAANRDRRLRLEAIDRAAHAKRATMKHVRVDHRRADVRVPEQLLHGSDVVPILEVCREWVPECVWPHALRYPGLS